MADLKPIGSEKLPLPDKLKRIIEITSYKTAPQLVEDTIKSDYSIILADGATYHIFNEKQGYVIKKGINESSLDYIEPMKNRKYYSSYSAAFKRLNLLAGEINRVTGNESGVSLYGEQKKYTLRTPKVSEPSSDVEPISPPSVPQPQLPEPGGMGSSTPQEPSFGDTSGMNMSDPSLGGDLDSLDQMGSMGGSEQDFDFDMDTEPEMPMTGGEDGDRVSMKTIQKLTGKLRQKLSTLITDEGMTSKDMKYVINSILSAFDLNELSDEDREDILSKFEESDEFGGDYDSYPEPDMEDMSGMDFTDELTPQQNEYNQIPEPMSNYGVRESINRRRYVNEAANRTISKYFDGPKYSKNNLRNNVTEINRLSETTKQRVNASKFAIDNTNSRLIGKTNLGNLIFESNGREIKITTSGKIL